MISYKEKLNNIKTVILDVDGVLTDGNLILLPTGEMVRTMNTRDGYAMQLAIKQGIRIAVITGGRDEAVVNRLKYLGLTDIYVNKRDKVEAFEDLLSFLQQVESQMLFCLQHSQLDQKPIHHLPQSN